MGEHGWNHSLSPSEPNATGCVPSDTHQVAATRGAHPRPLAHAWISEELLADTKVVWAAVYGCAISEEEAMEILTNVRHTADVLFAAAKELHL